MTYLFNRGPVVEAIAQFFGIKGEFTQTLTREVRPVLQIAQLDDSPYLNFSIPVGRGISSGAVAAEFSVGVICPGASVVLQVNQLIVRNTAATAADLNLTVMLASEIVTAGLAVGARVLDLSKAGSARRPSFTLVGSHTGQLGAGMGGVVVPADSTLLIPLPRPGIFLYGNEEGGVSGLALWQEVVNTQLDFSFYGREWPLPG